MGVKFVIVSETCSLCGVLQRKYSEEIKEQKYENQNILKEGENQLNDAPGMLACFTGGVDDE